MDAFESVVSTILQRCGYWTQTSVKVELTKEEKREIGRHSSPRWELDVVGYSGRSNELLVVECKSFLDSRGVQCSVFDGSNPEGAKRYKLFCEETLCSVVLNRLRLQFFEQGFCPADPHVTLCLAAGKIDGDEKWLERQFELRGWRLWSPSFICKQLQSLRDSGYENSVVAVVTKLLLRQSKASKGRA